MNFVPITEEDRKQMLRTIGVNSFEALIDASVPPELPRANLKIEPGLSEPELTRLLRSQADKNADTHSYVSFLGAGAYEHHIPAAVRYIFSRGEFLTAYTPYQPEASQGTLQAMYEYQSLICDLTGMDLANASLYDGASALAEAVILALRQSGRKKLVLSGSVHPEYLQTVRTYLKGADVEIVQIPPVGGVVGPEQAEPLVDEQTAAVVFQVPNAFGCLEQPGALTELAHAQGALAIAVVNPISLGLLAPPGEYGADIVVGEGQPLGTDLMYGGPYLGLFACKEAILRKIPGRIVGMTQDSKGRRGFVLTMQTREQHIRRSKATSNICTNEAMMALNAAVYLSALGKAGFQELARQNLSKARYGYDRLIKIPGVEPLFDAPFFNEFALSLPVDPEQLNNRLYEKGFVGGLALKRWDPSLSHGWLVCITEVRTREEIDRFAAAVEESL